MKPITDDVVQSLLNGLEMREKKALKKLHQTPRVTEAGSMTARVLRFGHGLGRGAKGAEDTNKILDLVEARRARHAKRTRSGLFSYSAQL